MSKETVGYYGNVSADIEGRQDLSETLLTEERSVLGRVLMTCKEMKGILREFMRDGKETKLEMQNISNRLGKMEKMLKDNDESK